MQYWPGRLWMVETLSVEGNDDQYRPIARENGRLDFVLNTTKVQALDKTHPKAAGKEFWAILMLMLVECRSKSATKTRGCAMFSHSYFTIFGNSCTF